MSHDYTCALCNAEDSAELYSMQFLNPRAYRNDRFGWDYYACRKCGKAYVIQTQPTPFPIVVGESYKEFSVRAMTYAFHKMQENKAGETHETNKN